MKARREKKKRALADDLSPAELAKHVQAMHGVPARFVEAVEVKEEHEGRTVWEGALVARDASPTRTRRLHGSRAMTVLFRP